MNKKVTRDSGRVRKSQDQDQDPVADVYETMDSLKVRELTNNSSVMCDTSSVHSTSERRWR